MYRLYCGAYCQCNRARGTADRLLVTTAIAAIDIQHYTSSVLHKLFVSVVQLLWAVHREVIQVVYTLCVQQYTTPIEVHLHAILKLTINYALNTVSNGAADVTGLSVKLLNGVRYFSTNTSTTTTTITTPTTTNATTVWKTD